MCSERLFAFDKMWRDEVMRRRKMVLKRRIRMVIAAFILILIGILVIPISHFKVAAGEKNMRQIEYKTYVVQYGDTLWGLADSYMGKNFKNHQDYIHDVMRANSMNQAMIYEGQLLIIPCEGDVAENIQMAAAGKDMRN